MVKTIKKRILFLLVLVIIIAVALLLIFNNSNIRRIDKEVINPQDGLFIANEYAKEVNNDLTLIAYGIKIVGKDAIEQGKPEIFIYEYQAVNSSGYIDYYFFEIDNDKMSINYWTLEGRENGILFTVVEEPISEIDISTTLQLIHEDLQSLMGQNSNIYISLFIGGIDKSTENLNTYYITVGDNDNNFSYLIYEIDIAKKTVIDSYKAPED